MPRFDPGQLPWLGETFVSKLPDPSIALVGDLGAFNPTSWATGLVVNATELTGHLARDVATSIGWPDSAVGELAALGAVIVDLADGRISLDTAVAAALQAVDLLSATLQGVAADVTAAVAQAVAGAATVIPIVGWLLQIALFVARGIKVALQRVTAGAEDTPVQWSHGRDQKAANDVLAILRGGDWTSIWLPRTADWSAITVSYDPWGKQSGWRFQPGGVFADDRQGWMPGIAQGSAFYEGPVWGLKANGSLALPREKCLVQGKDCPRSSPVAMPTSTQATLHPSALVLAGLAWTFTERLTGACAAFDFDALDSAWASWQREGIRFVDAKPGDGPRARALRAMVRGALGYHGDLYPSGTMLVGDQIRSILRERRELLWRQLGTIAVAYVRPDAPGLRTGRMRGRYDAMQRALLQHSARYEVDLALVPAGDFRNALVASRKTPEGIGLAAPGRVGSARRRGETIDRGPSPRRPRLPGLGGPSGSGAAVLAALVAAFLVL